MHSHLKSGSLLPNSDRSVNGDLYIVGPVPNLWIKTLENYLAASKTGENFIIFLRKSEGTIFVSEFFYRTNRHMTTVISTKRKPTS